MKLLKLIAALLVTAVSAVAQSERSFVVPLTANTANFALTNRWIIPELKIINSSTNTATIKFYDSGGVTNRIRSAYVSSSSAVTTNTSVFTNYLGLVITNTYIGLTTTYTTNASVTNELQRLGTFAVPAGVTATVQPNWLTSLGLTALSDNTLTITLTGEYVGP